MSSSFFYLNVGYKNENNPKRYLNGKKEKKNLFLCIWDHLVMKRFRSEEIDHKESINKSFI